MSELITAKSAGFCFGVKRAVDKVYETIENNVNNKQIYTYGPIIHNDEVVKDIALKGVKIIETEEELSALNDGIVIIRSHGVPERICNILDEKGIEYIDMTCPFVKRIHNAVSNEDVQGNIVIFGSRNHPEVIGIKGWCKKEAAIIENSEEASLFNGDKSIPLTIVSQTTFNHYKFQELVEIFTKNGYNTNVVNTICDATKNRQTEAEDIASGVDCMIVIGDKKSSNSRKLYDICLSKCNNTHFIQNVQELDISDMDNVETVGITAGASTPNKLIEEVQNYVRTNF